MNTVLKGVCLWKEKSMCEESLCFKQLKIVWTSQQVKKWKEMNASHSDLRGYK